MSNTKGLKLDAFTIEDSDTKGDFMIEGYSEFAGDFYKVIDIKEAKRLLQFLQKNIDRYENK